MLNVDVNKLIAEYVAGVSEYQLSKDFGISRCAIRVRLVSANVPIRGQSEAGRTRVSRLGLPKNLQKVWANNRGKKIDEEILIRRAKKAQSGESKISIGRDEKVASLAFRRVGLKIIRQYAVGRYNLDIAIPSVNLGIEIQTGSFDRMGPGTSAKRLKYIFNSGWRVVCVIAWHGGGIDWPIIAKKILAYCNRLRRNKSSVGKYGMIRGNGDTSSALAAELKDFPRIPGF